MIHPLSDVHTSHIGENTSIWQFSVVLQGAVIGANCNVNCHCFIENDVVIGDNVTVKSGVQLWDGLRVEENVFIGPNVTFTNDPVPRSKVYLGKYEKTTLQSHASIGANATILVGVTIGRFALVGAGSVVTRDVPPYTVWYGNPARHRGYITGDSVLLDMKLVDNKTGVQYRLEGEKLVKE
ncbi:acetyltransferase-like isoleucine patch superfamily enzyme [Dinghuibacter silviterrae]|uniref:Acetyltransferase-like isoleucine patch superfamily enzyme n=1 Tax=Dinghuibacter silviterrae TaxID=1539049 RepID=A0A4R8DPL4_9BACT|nr:acyltransferase [Dinghuibacter silviterrae]TDX00060.1 acetyltransferase-like isoleucine patch superfamily enzyme [Dinghuibacter silviterrae]